MQKDNGDAKEKHARTNEKHARVVVLREKGLEENEGKTREEWNPKEDMKAMQKKYEIKWWTKSLLRCPSQTFGTPRRKRGNRACTAILGSGTTIAWKTFLENKTLNDSLHLGIFFF